MSEKLNIRTNNVPRDTIDGFTLSATERKEFDFLDWPAIDDGRDSATFVRYQGDLIYINDFQSTRDFPADHPLRVWDGYASDSFSSGTLLRYVEDGERVIMGRYYYAG